MLAKVPIGQSRFGKNVQCVEMIIALRAVSEDVPADRVGSGYSRADGV